MKPRALALMGLASLIVISSCSEETDDNNNQTAQESTPSPTIPAGAGGGLIAIQTKTTQSTPIGEMEILFGTAVAVFGPSGAFLDAGVVSVNNESLDKQSNNSYTYMPGPTSATGISFNNGAADWDVAGSGSVSAFTFSDTQTWPSIGAIDHSGSVSTSSDFTLQATTSITNADSVIFSVAGPSGNLLFTAPSGTNAHTFSQAEMATVGAGQGYIQIAPYQVNVESINGENYYFIKETVVSESVTLE